MTNFHPIFVHFTIALLIMAVLFDLLGWVLKRDSLVQAGWWNLIFALPSALTSLFSGLYAEESIEHGKVLHELMEKHESLGFVVVGVVALLFVWRVVKKGAFYDKWRLAYVSVGVVGVMVLSLGGWIGGEMVYKHGAGVNKKLLLQRAAIYNTTEAPRAVIGEVYPEGVDKLRGDEVDEDDEHEHGDHEH
ncbi:DUF2231 domain-containing protein [Calditrichota bacterium]